MADLDEKTRELDHAFERTLLESALGDAPPRGATSVAWLRFAGSIAAATAMHAGGKLPEAAAAGGNLGAAAAGGKLGAAAAAKWLLIGAIGGSSITAAAMHAARAPDPTPVAAGTAAHAAGPVNPRVGVARSGAAPEGSAAENRTTSPLGSVAPAELSRAMRPPVAGESSAPASTEAGSSVPVRSAPASAGHRREQRSSGAGSVVSTASSDDARRSTLAAQVALIDAARTANSVGAADDALRLIEKYRREFPKGELAADAEVVAIEALGSKGDSGAAARQARRFLARYPNDPHTGYVTGVAASASPQEKAPSKR